VFGGLKEYSMSEIEIAHYWSRIEQWLATHMTAALQFLPGGVSHEALLEAESTLGYEIPGQLKKFLLIHDGSGDIVLHDYGVFMSLKQMMANWDMEVDLWGDGDNDEWAQPSGPIKKRWYAREWLPVLDTRAGNYPCLDLDPAEGGTRGQIISWLHDSGPTEVIAPTFNHLLDEFVMKLEAGFYKPAVNQGGQPYLRYIKGE
jgi:cell wall assembly regulator SMI1